MADTTFLQAIPLTTFDTAGLTTSFQALNGTGFEEPCKVMKWYNGGTVDIIISYDGVEEHDIAPAGSTFILDLETNAEGFGGSDGHWDVHKYQIIYGKAAGAGVGNMYIVGYH